MSQSNNPLKLAISAAIAAGSMFSMQAMAHGYMQDPPTAAKSDHEGGCGMAKMDTDKDGRLSRTEFDAAHQGSKETEMDAHHASMKQGDAKAMDDAAMKKMQAEGKCGEGKCGGGA